ncbi:MAG: hypothetical protein IE886_04165 [Campylobacterales bacterium]|nr:hypothetical protein [Campylobacterales bacterium]
MRTLLLYFLLIGALQAADVNATLYESSDKPALYKALAPADRFGTGCRDADAGSGRR